MKKNTPQKLFSYDCTIDSDNSTVAELHKKTHDEIMISIKEFFGSDIPGGKSFMLDDIAFDFTLNCDFYTVRFSFDDSATTTNDDITPDMSLIGVHRPVTYNGKALNSSVKYSIHLFKGIMKGYDVDEIVCYKAKESYDGEEYSTVVFVGKSKGVAVYNGDLTSMYPITDQ